MEYCNITMCFDRYLWVFSRILFLEIKFKTKPPYDTHRRKINNDFVEKITSVFISHIVIQPIVLHHRRPLPKHQVYFRIYCIIFSTGRHLCSEDLKVTNSLKPTKNIDRHYHYVEYYTAIILYFIIEFSWKVFY